MVRFGCQPVAGVTKNGECLALVDAVVAAGPDLLPACVLNLPLLCTDNGPKQMRLIFAEVVGIASHGTLGFVNLAVYR